MRLLEFPPEMSDQCDDERRTDRVRDRRKIRPKTPAGAHAGLGTVRHDDEDDDFFFKFSCVGETRVDFN